MDRMIHGRPTIGGQGFRNMKDDVEGKFMFHETVLQSITAVTLLPFKITVV